MRRKLPILSALLFLYLVGHVSALSNEGPYFINMGNISDRLYSGEANLLFMGDSITVQTSTPRMFYGVIRKWSPVNWRGIITQSSSGVSDQGTVITNEPTSSSIKTTIDAGQNYTLPNGTIIRGWNLNKVGFYNFTNDSTSFGTAITMKVNVPFTAWSDDWTANNSLTARFIYLSSPALNPYQVRARNVFRNGTTSTAQEPLTLLNSTSLGINSLEVNYTNLGGDGNSSTGLILTIGNRNESAKADDSEFYPLGTRIFRNDIDTGLQIGQAGGGGFTTKSHTVGGEALTLDGVVINTSYSNEALDKWIEINELNTFLIWLGQNAADDEWNGLSTRNYSKNILEIINRYTDAYYRVNTTTNKPYFILVSTYDTSNSNAKFVAMENDLINISVNSSIRNAEIGLIQLRQFINDTNGTYTSWNNTYTEDGIHPSQYGALEFATYLWNQIVLGLTNQNITSGGMKWIADSHLVSNSSTESQSLILNNTGLLKSEIQVYNLSRALLYLDNYSFVGVGNVFTNNINLNLTLAPGRAVTILNNFNLTESANRNSSPLWFSSSSSSSKAIASNLTDTINSSVSFSVSSCSIDTISYLSDTGNYSKTYSSGEYSCSGSVVTLNVTGLESASGSNTISISYTQSPGSSSSSTSSGDAASFSLTLDDLKEGYSRTLYKKWSLKFSLNNEMHSLVLEDIKNNSVIVAVSSKPMIEEIFLGEVGKFNLDNDRYYDLHVEVEEIAKSRLFAVLKIKSVHEKIPEEEELFDVPVAPEAPGTVLSIFTVLLLVILIAIIALWKSRQKKVRIKR